jgi:hypothetical protein
MLHPFLHVVETSAADAHTVLPFTVVGVMCPIFLAYPITLGNPNIPMCDCQLSYCLLLLPRCCLTTRAGVLCAISLGYYIISGKRNISVYISQLKPCLLLLAALLSSHACRCPVRYLSGLLHHPRQTQHRSAANSTGRLNNGSSCHHMHCATGHDHLDSQPAVQILVQAQPVFCL